MVDLNRKEAIMKFIVLILAIIVYGLLIGYHTVYSLSWERILVTAIFAGFMIVYIALVIALLMDRDVAKELAAIWALYATAAYLSCGILLIVRYHNTSEDIAIADGALAMVTSVFTFLDCIFTAMS